MTLISINVPQADDIDRVIALVKCLYNNGNTNHFALSVVKRQVDYYLNAARILGLVDRCSQLTMKGIAVAVSNNPYPTVADQFKSSDVYQAWLNWSMVNGFGDVQVGTAEHFLSDYFGNTTLPKHQKLTDNASNTGTIPRRAKTLDDWRYRLQSYM